MKAKYYSDSNVLSAKLGQNPSYVWRVIFASLESVKVGARRKIGDSENTLVWRDPWLPDEENGYVRMVEFNQLSNTKVSNLMMSGERKWDIELLDDLFDVRTSDLVKRISLSTHVGSAS